MDTDHIYVMPNPRCITSTFDNQNIKLNYSMLAINTQSFCDIKDTCYIDSVLHNSILGSSY